MASPSLSFWIPFSSPFPTLSTSVPFNYCHFENTECWSYSLGVSKEIFLRGIRSLSITTGLPSILSSPSNVHNSHTQPPLASSLSCDWDCMQTLCLSLSTTIADTGKLHNMTVAAILCPMRGRAYSSTSETPLCGTSLLPCQDVCLTRLRLPCHLFVDIAYEHNLYFTNSSHHYFCSFLQCSPLS